MEIIWNYEWNIEIPCEHHPGQQQSRWNSLSAFKRKTSSTNLGGNFHLDTGRAKWKKIKFFTVFLIETLAKHFSYSHSPEKRLHSSVHLHSN